MTITDQDMRNQVTTALAGSEGDYDIDGIVSEIQEHFGTVPIDDVPHEDFWTIVAAFDASPTGRVTTTIVGSRRFLEYKTR